VTITNKTVRDAHKNLSEDLDLINQKPELKGQFKDSIAAGKNIRLPNGQWLSPEAQIMLDKSIVARGLGVPATEEIIVKNHSYRYFWGNRLAAGGSRYAQLKTMGYTNATLDDVEPKAVEIEKDQNEIRSGDVVLMKISIERWMAHERYKMERSMALQRRTRTYFDKNPNPDVNSNENPVMVDAQNQSSGDGKYLRHYQPTQAELDAKMGSDPVGGK